MVVVFRVPSALRCLDMDAHSRQESPLCVKKARGGRHIFSLLSQQCGDAESCRHYFA